MALTKASAGGDYFNPKDHMLDLAIIIEGKRILKDQDHEYDGVKSKRDVAIADISCFRNYEDIENETPSLILEGANVTASILVSDIEANGWLDGEGGVAVIRKPKRAYVFRSDAENLKPDAEAAAFAYYERRNAEVEANLDDVPDY